MRIRGARYNSIIKILFSRAKFIFVLGFVALTAIAFPLVRKINQQRALAREIEALAAEAEKVEQKNSDLRAVLGYLESSGFAEKEARLNLDLKKPGEKVVVIKGDENQATTTEAVKSLFNVPGLDKAVEPQTTSNSQKWLEYFFRSPNPEKK